MTGSQRKNDHTSTPEMDLAAILDIADDAIILLDAEQRIIRFNQGAEKIFGYEAAELLGRLLDPLLPEHFVAAHRRHLIEFENSPDNARRMGKRRDIYGKRKDGTTFPAEASIAKLDVQGETTFAVILRDISARKRADDTLRLSQAQLAGILDIADDAIISIDEQQRITRFNQGAEKIFGYSVAEILGQPLERLLPERFRASHDGYIHAFAHASDHARRMGERQDIYGLRKDGVEFPAEASISRLELAGEKIYTVILRDITERKRINQTLRDQNADLERAIKAKDRFLANMSHELRTPLNAVIGFTGTLLMRLPGPLTADQEKQLKTVRNSAQHLLALINDLLDLAKIDSGKIDLRLEPVVCRQVIAEVADSLQQLAEAKQLRFEVVLPETDVVLFADRRALSQILLNLTSNAIKFTTHGHVHLEVVRRALATGIQTEFSVTDTGSGIEPADQAHLFEAFERGAATGSSDGSGLGLHLSQKLAGLLGGWIECSSIFGQGSTFTLVIPGR
jgi:PAS domain S-box-containing protein